VPLVATTALLISLLADAAVPPSQATAPGDSVVFSPNQKPSSYPLPDAVERVGTRGLDVYKATCVAAGKVFEAMERIAGASGLRNATDDELRQLNETAVHSRLPVIEAAAWVGKIDEFEYWVYLSTRQRPSDEFTSCSVFAPPGVQDDIVERMKNEFGGRIFVNQQFGPARLVMTQGWAYAGQRSSFPSFAGGAAADLFSH